MKFYIKIDNNEYLVPQAVVNANKELFNEYMIFIDNDDVGKKYLNLDKLIKDKSDNDILRICDQCVGSIRMLSLSMDNDFFDEFDNLFSSKLNSYRIEIEELFKSNDYNGAYKRIYILLDIMLGFYNKMNFEDETQYKKKKK